MEMENEQAERILGLYLSEWDEASGAALVSAVLALREMRLGYDALSGVCETLLDKANATFAERFEAWDAVSMCQQIAQTATAFAD